MAVDGYGEVSACGRGIGDLGFRDDATGVSVSVSDEEEIDILSEGEDIMVGVSGADIFFDGIYGREGQEEDVGIVRDIDEDEFNNFQIHIDETLEIKDYENYEVQKNSTGGAESSEEIVSRVRALVQSLPLSGQISPQEVVHSLPGQISPQEMVHSFSLPGQISPQEVVPIVNPRSFASDNSCKETKYDGSNQRSSSLKRKHESIDVKPKELGSSGKNHVDLVFYSMSSRFQEFEDFLNASTKYVTAEDKTVSKLQIPVQAAQKDCNQNLFKQQLSEDSKTDLPGEDSLVSPVNDIKDSFWTDMVIHTDSPAKLPAVDTLRSKKTLNYNHVPMAATATTDKYSPAELILTFDRMEAIPSESKLNIIFRRFGPLIQSDTLIYHESCCARVVFKKSSDAEVAVSSAKAFNILGPSVVKYELGYTPLSATSVMQNVQEYKPESVNAREYEPEVATAGELEPEDMPAQQMHLEQLEETSMEEVSVPLESEEYEGLDDVDIME